MRLLHQTGVVVALGGGAVTSPLIRERLRDGSFTVLLDVSPQTAWRRIEAEAGDRPLAAEARGFAELYEQRRGLYHAAADALVDAEEVHGDEALLAPLARPGALAELPRLIGARRAALVADRAVLRLVGAPFEPFVTVRLPAGEPAKTVAVARQAWTRLARARAGARRRRRRPGRRRCHRRGRLRRRDATTAASPGSLCRRRSSGMVDAAMGGKTGIDLPAAQERGRRVPPAGVGRLGPGRARDAARAGVGVRVRRGDQDRRSWRAAGCGRWCGSGSRAGARPSSAWS